MKKLDILICIGLIVMSSILFSSCNKYLDVNDNPNSPSVVEPNLYLSPMEANFAVSVQYDSRYLGKYVQNWCSSSASDTWDRHGYLSGSDASGEIWKAVYWEMGNNLTNMISQSKADSRWDLLGIGTTLRALGWQTATDTYGPIIMTQAFDASRTSFDYDSQKDVYAEVVRMCKESIGYLNRTDGQVSSSYAAVGDMIYKGDRIKWKKFTFGLLAINASHLSNKSYYKPEDVISYVDSAFTSNADNALVPFNGNVSTDTNFYGPMRDNLENFRPTQFLISLLDGTVFGIADPRLKVMVAPAPDGVYRGLIPTQGMGSLTTSQKPNNPWNENTAPTTATKGRFLYTNKASFPLMTYSELQLIKAEAALKANKASVALDAYKKAVTAHFDFVNQYADTPISASDRDTYLATVIPTDPAALTLSMVMLQKYIAQFGWGYHETWSDLRRYHYSSDVFTGFTLPSSDVLWPDNNGLPAQRFRPRYNSEYVWNKAALDKVKGFDKNYHTYEMWFTKTIDTELY